MLLGYAKQSKAQIYDLVEGSCQISRCKIGSMGGPVYA
jgi:hypothetical protein